MNIVQSLSIALPEILLLIGVSVVLLADVLINGPQIPRDNKEKNVKGVKL